MNKEQKQAIANSVVQQYYRDQGIQQLQAEIEAANREQGIAALQAEIDAMNKASAPAPVSQPVQQPVQQPKQTQQIPSLADFRTEDNLRYRQEKRALAQEKKQRENYQRQQQEEQILATKGAKEEKQKQAVNRLATNETLNRLDTMTQMGLAKEPTQEEKWLDPEYKMTSEDKKAAREYAQSELAKFDYNSSKQPILTDKNRQHYADMVNLLNKTNGVTNALTGVIKQPLNLARAVRDAGRTVTNDVTGLGAAIGDKLGITEGATQRHNEKVAERDAFYNQNDESMQRAYQNAKTQNPLATSGGEIAGQMAMYMLTNPLFDSLGAAAGLGKAGSFALNQVGQNAQDWALDTAPMLNELKQDGELSKEDYEKLAMNVASNAGLNLLIPSLQAGLGGADKLAYEELAKTVGNNADIFKTMDNTGALRNVPDAAREVVQSFKGADEAQRQIDDAYNSLPVLEEDVIAKENDQLRSLMDQYNGQFKDESAMKNIFSPEDLEASQNAQLRSLMEDNLIPERLNPQVEMEPPKGMYEADALSDEIRAMNDEMGNAFAPEVKEVNPDDVVYHSGTLSRLNKAETRGKMSEGSRNTGYFGTGHYFVDGQHKVELDNNSLYKKQPYSSVDISKYDNLYKATTDQQASDLHDFSQKYTRYVNGYNDKYFTGDEGIDEVAKAEYLDDLYNQFRRLFPEQNTSKEAFLDKLETFKKSEKDIDLMNRDDSVFTQFMKDMGYNGVDTRGTRSADTSRGVVIYDLDEDSILQSNVTADDVKQGLMNTKVRNENEPIFDAAEDARIQKIIDQQKNKAAVLDEYHRLYDDTALKEAQGNYDDINKQLTNLEENAKPYYERLVSDEAYLDKEVKGQLKEFEQFGISEDFETAKAQKLESARASLAEIDEKIAGLRQQLADAKGVLDEQDNLATAAYKQAQENINKPAVEPAKLLTDDEEYHLLANFNDINASYWNNYDAITKSLETKDFSIPDAVINHVPGKDGKMKYQVVQAGNQRVIKEYKTLKAAEKAQAEYIAGDALKAKAQKAFKDIDSAISKYEYAAFNSTDVEEVNTAKKALEAARKRYERAMKELDPTYYDAVSGKDFADRIVQPYYTRNPKAAEPVKEVPDDIIQSWVDYDVNRPNRWTRNVGEEGKPPKTWEEVQAEEAAKSVPGADPLQTFAEGPKDKWKTSKARTNTIEKLGWGDKMPEKDFAYRVYSEAEQRADAVERYKDSKNVFSDLMNKNDEDFDELDVKMAFNEAQRLLDQGDRKSLGKARSLMEKSAAVQRQGGRVVQASAEFTRNTAVGAITDAEKMLDDRIVNPWKTTNKKAVEGNSRIAKALADMGHKPDVKVKPELTHDQIKKGVIAEIEREVGSVEKYFNDNDIEFLTQMAEDKKIPVWQITSEIEHKLNTGDWYTLDESIPIPKPTNTKLQGALNSLIENEVRATEKTAPTLQQITEEVRNTLAKEAADFEGQFTDDDIDYIANLINNGATKNELAEALNTRLATGSFGISDETLQQVNSIFKEISRFDPNSKQFVEGQAEAYRLLADEVVGDATAMEKFEAWRYLAMLGNPKTMLRNFIGNQTFGVVTGVSNNLAALAEAGIDKGIKKLGGEGIQRTKSVLNPIKDMDLIKASAEDADISRYRQIVGSKYEKMDADALRRSKSVFNTKLAQFYEKVTDAGISDYSAVKNKFSTSLAGYLKANGYDTSIFKAEDELARLKNLSETRLLSDAERAKVEKLTKDVAELEKGRDFALKQAEYATFHEDNAIATALTRASRYLRTSDHKALNAAGAMLEGIVPFKKTPANVLKSGLEYSPLGAIDSIKKTGKLVYENTGKRAGNLAETYLNKKGKEVTKTLASDVIDSWSKTLTGTGLTALGFYLYDKGVLNSSDKDLKYQDQLEGKQNYSLTINGKTYTIDWAAPTAMPLLLGAEIAKVWRDSGNDVENWYDHLDEYLNAANRLADPLIETSMLQGVKDTLETAANAAKYDENLNIPTLIGYNTLTGYLTQAIPTLGGQVARTVDNTRRSTYTDKEGVAGTLEKQGRKLMNKIPGLSMLNEPYIDTYGREQKNSPFGNAAANLAYQMFSPGYLADINTTDADTMARDVYEKSGKSDNILPKWNSYFKDSEGNRVSPEDYTQASRVAGETQSEIRNALANDEWFNSLNDAEKEDIVNDINTISANMGKSSIDPEFVNTNKSYVAYKEGGLQGLMDHFKNRQASNVAQESGLNTSTKAAQAIKEDVLSGNTEAAQEKIDAATSLQNLGLNKPGPAYTYYNAQSIIPGLTTEDFAKTYKAIDSDGNQGIKQDEVIAYLNKQKITSESEAKKIWDAYGSSTWKSIPKLDNGTWKKKKK